MPRIRAAAAGGFTTVCCMGDTTPRLDSGAELAALRARAEEMVGASILKIIPYELRSEEDMILSKVRAGHKVEHFETVRLRKDGRRVHVSMP